jgi:hypothetical protein
MKTQRYAFAALLAIMIAIAGVVTVTESTSAQGCTDARGNDIPCEEKERKVRPTVTDIPSPTPVDTPTPVPLVICTTPDAAELALLCSNLRGSDAGDTNTEPIIDPVDAPSDDELTTNPAPPEDEPPFWAWLLGGGGLLIGLAAGQLLPPFLRGFPGGPGHPPDPGFDTSPKVRKVKPFSKVEIDDGEDAFVKMMDDKVELSDHKVELGDHKVELGDHKVALGDHKVELGDHKVELGGADNQFPKLEDDGMTNLFPK